MRRKVPVKVAAAVLSAAMVMSGLPATAGFAAEPNVQAEAVTDVNSKDVLEVEEADDTDVLEADATIPETDNLNTAEDQDVVNDLADVQEGTEAVHSDDSQEKQKNDGALLNKDNEAGDIVQSEFVTSDAESVTLESDEADQEQCKTPSWLNNLVFSIDGYYISGKIWGDPTTVDTSYTYYYTTDGSVPSASNGTSLSAAYFQAAGAKRGITQDIINHAVRDDDGIATIKAVAVKEGMQDSDIAEFKIQMAPEGAVLFADQNLKNAILKALNKDTSAVITEEDMRSLTELDLSDSGIVDLTGLFEAVNLKKLDLSGNRLFSDIIRGNKNNINKAFEPFSVFTKLEELDLSGCAIGDNVIYANVTTPSGNVWDGGMPNSLSTAVMKLPELKVLDLSDNELANNFSLTAGMFPKLQKLDLSDNDLHEFTMFNYSRKFFPDLTTIDLSGNYYVWDEIGEDFYPLVEDGISILHENEKNPAEIWAVVRESSSGQMTQNQMPVILPRESDEVDLGTVYGDSIKLYIATYEGASSTKITILDQKFTASMHTIMYPYIKDEYFEVKGLADGDNTLPVTVMYQNGQTKEYTFKVRAVSHVEQEETEEYVKIRDASVYKYLCGQLGKADEVGTYKITKADLASLSGSLSVPACTEISWLKYCINITEFVPEKLSVNDPQDSYAEVPDLSGLTKLNTLTICSSSLTQVPDLSGLTSLTTLTVLPTTKGEYPDVSVLSGLQNVNVYHASGKLPGGMEKLANLQSLRISSDSGEYLIDKTNLPSVFGEANTKVNTNLMLSGSGTVTFGDMTGVTARGSNLSLWVNGDVVIKFAKPETMPFNRFTFNGTGSVTSDRLPDNMNQIPSVIWLQFDAWNGDELTFNDGFKDLDQIQSITFKDLNMTKIPEQLATWDSLKYLTLSGVPLTKMDTDLSGTNLTALNLYETKLASVPDASLLPESLTSLSCYAAFPLTKMEGDYSKLVNLATLDLSYCSLSEIPKAIGSLTGLQTLNLGNNYYSDVPAGLFDRLEKLKTVTLGNMIPLTYIGGMLSLPSSYQLTEGTQAAAELTKLKDRGVTVNLTVALSPFSQLAQASLDGKDLYIDRNARVMEAEYPAGTEKASLDLRAVYDDSKITIGDKTVTGKGTFELDLHDGYNEIPFSVFNEFTDVRCTDQTTNYKLSIYVGEKSSLQTMETGRYYQVDSKILKHGKSGASMADLYIAHKAILRKRADGRYEFYLDSLKASWMNTLQIYGENGEKMMSDIVAEDKTADTFRARFIVDEVTVPFTLNLFVNPMGYAPDCDVYFDLSSMIDITDIMPEGDTADLAAAVGRANEITKQRDVYTKESRDSFDEALAKASAVLENKKSTQDEIDAAVSELSAAIDALAFDYAKLADKTSLEEALTTAKALTKGKHTDTNWEALQEAIADAQEVYDDIYATTKEAEAAAKYLNNAVKAFNSSGEASTLDPANLEDGVYTAYVDMINASNPDQKSMSDNAVTKPVTITVKNGEYTVTANFHGIYITLAGQSFFGYMKELSYWDGEKYALVTVDTTYDVVDEFNDADNDGKADYLYPHQMTFPLVNKDKGDDEDGFVHVQVFVPIMESISEGSGTQQALMKIDWTSLQEGDEAANEAVKAEKARNELSEAVADAKNITTSGYTDASVQALNQAISDAEALLKDTDATRAQLESAKQKLDTAVAGLTKKAAAKNEWIKSGNRWWYRHADGSYTTNGWEKIDNVWYYFDGAGWMKTGWVKDGNTWYYLKSSGAMATGWQKVNNVWYYFKSSGAMQTGWQKISNVWYYFNASGAMQTGWQKVSGKWYYFNTSGAMQTGWLKLGGKWYYCNSSGAMVTGTQTISGKTYQFDANGVWLS